jgi:hypothetical protein
VREENRVHIVIYFYEGDEEEVSILISLRGMRRGYAFSELHERDEKEVSTKLCILGG